MATKKKRNTNSVRISLSAVRSFFCWLLFMQIMPHSKLSVCGVTYVSNEIIKYSAHSFRFFEFYFHSFLLLLLFGFLHHHATFNANEMVRFLASFVCLFLYCHIFVCLCVCFSYHFWSSIRLKRAR